MRISRHLLPVLVCGAVALQSGYAFAAKVHIYNCTDKKHSYQVYEGTEQIVNIPDYDFHVASGDHQVSSCGTSNCWVCQNGDNCIKGAGDITFIQWPNQPTYQTWVGGPTNPCPPSK